MHQLRGPGRKQVTGDVRLKLYRGSCTVAGRTSPHSLYDERFVTFGEDDVYQQSDAAGFIRLYGLPMRVAALKKAEAEAEGKAEAGAAGAEVYAVPRFVGDVVEPVTAESAA